MKIAMIGQKGIPAISGGVEKHVEELSTRLVNNGNKVTVYCRNTYSKEKEITSYNGVNIKYIKTINNKNLDAIIYTLKATLHALFVENYDVYHYHALGPASLSFIPKLFGKKVVVTIHGLDWQRDKWGKFAKLYLKFGEIITGKYANKIISVSNNLKVYFQKKYNRNDEDVIFIPNGVKILEPLSPNIISKKYGLSTNEYILFLARLVPEKGVHYLIDAYKQIDTKKKLVIAGGSSFSDTYVEKLYNKAKGYENIIFTGNVTGDEVIELYSNCYTYVLPSDVEGMPLTLLEAMSFGTFSIISNIKECIDILKDRSYGVSFEKSNIDDLRDVMIETLNLDLENTQDKCAVKEYIKKNYNWDDVSLQTLNIYEEVI